MREDSDIVVTVPAGSTPSGVSIRQDAYGFTVCTGCCLAAPKMMSGAVPTCAACGISINVTGSASYWRGIANYFIFRNPSKQIYELRDWMNCWLGLDGKEFLSFNYDYTQVWEVS